MYIEFKYIALTKNGQRMNGLMHAVNRDQLRQNLMQKELFLISAHHEKKTYLTLNRPWQNLPVLERWLSCMTQFLSAGLSFNESLELSVKSSDRDVAKLGLRLQERIVSGQTLFTAARSEIRIFGSQYPALFARAESTGDLLSALTEMLESVRWRQRLRLSIRNIITYPCLLMALISGVCLFLLVSVVPHLSELVTAFGGEIPWHTRALLAVSGFAQNYWIYPVAFVCIAPIIFYVIFYKSHFLKHWSEDLIIRVPIIGVLILQIRLAEFFHNLGVMYRSKLPILEILTHLQNAQHNATFKRELEYLRQKITAGSSLSCAFRYSHAFPDMIWRIVSVGENSGEFDNTFRYISDYFDEQIAYKVKRIEQSLPSVLILIIGVIMTWLIVSVLAPIYDHIIGSGAVL